MAQTFENYLGTIEGKLVNYHNSGAHYQFDITTIDGRTVSFSGGYSLAHKLQRLHLEKYDNQTIRMTGESDTVKYYDEAEAEIEQMIEDEGIDPHSEEGFEAFSWYWKHYIIDHSYKPYGAEDIVLQFELVSPELPPSIIGVVASEEGWPAILERKFREIIRNQNDVGYSLPVERLAQIFVKSPDEINLEIDEYRLASQDKTSDLPNNLDSFVLRPMAAGRYIYGVHVAGIDEIRYSEGTKEGIIENANYPLKVFDGLDLRSRSIDVSYYMSFVKNGVCHFTQRSLVDDNEENDYVSKETIDKNLFKTYLEENRSDEHFNRIIESIGTKGSFFHLLIESLNPSMKWVYIKFNLESDANGQVDSYFYYATDRAELISFFEKQMVWFYRYIMYRQAQALRQATVNTAAASIMARNMSHNLGSHCISYTKDQLKLLSQSIIRHAPEVRGAAHLLEYLQRRMDYIATISAGDSYPYGSVNFKSQLLDVITVDEVVSCESKTKEQYKAVKKGAERILGASQGLYETINSLSKNKEIRIPEKQLEAIEKYNGVVSSIEGTEQHIQGSTLRPTFNYLLENLIKSEGFYREESHNILSIKDDEQSKKRFRINVRLNGAPVTEDRISELSKLNLALPGGTMSAHAFFNILENLIRNSAKHGASDLKEDSLITTIDIKEYCEKGGERRATFTIFDNKHNASKVYDALRGRLETLRFLYDDLTVDKTSKGLKEMVVSAVWMKANEFNKSFAAILNEIESSVEKKALIEKYAFSFVKVSGDGEDTDSKDANLGLRFTLPCFETICEMEIYECEDNNSPLSTIRQYIKNNPIHADIIELNAETKISIVKEAKRIFPRLYIETPKVLDDYRNRLLAQVREDIESRDCDPTLKYCSVLSNRFGEDIERYSVVFGNVSCGAARDDSKVVFFTKHLNTKLEEMAAAAKKYVYADSVSGGNFTSSLEEFFKDGIEKDKFKTWKDRYFSFKIVESALTRITIIDERFMGYDPEELKMKNIRVLNLNPNEMNESKAWIGTEFKDGSNYTLFLSIHLGLIEKMLEGSNWLSEEYERECKIPDKAQLFMNHLKKRFGEEGKDTFISIHSGRGNLSYELEHSLKDYPFISLSAIDSALSNSKYLLAQLFYNTIFIGKGEYNN